MIGKPSPQAEAIFISYTFNMICQKGGTRMQMTMADIAKELQKEDALHEVNLFRKAFGNITECMKYPKNKFYDIDSMIIRFKKHEEILQMFKNGSLNPQDLKIYEMTHEKNQQSKLNTLKVNKQNICKNCGEQYSMRANGQKTCQETQPHQPTYEF